jgi:hypothetical protein
MEKVDSSSIISPDNLSRLYRELQYTRIVDGKVISCIHLLQIEVLVEFIKAYELNKNPEYMIDEITKTMSEEKMIQSLIQTYSKVDTKNPEERCLEKKELGDFINSLFFPNINAQISSFSSDDDFDTHSLHNMFERMKQKVMANRVIKLKADQKLKAEQKLKADNFIIYKDKRAKSRVVIPHHESSFKSELDVDNESQIVIAIWTHGDDIPGEIFDPKDSEIRVINTVPCGYYSYSGLTNDIENLENSLSLRISVGRPIDYVESKLNTYFGSNADLFKCASGFCLSEKKIMTDFTSLTKDDFFKYAIPVFNRSYSFKVHGENFPMGIRILHWKNNPIIDDLLEKHTIPNYTNNNINSVHLLDNLYVIGRNMIADDKMRGIERNIERKNSRIVVDKTDSLKNNLAANYITEYDYIDYVEDNFCLDLMEKIELESESESESEPKSEPESESESKSKYKFEKKDDILELLNKFHTYFPLDQISITLQDITDLFSLLGYKNIIILDNGCRKSGAIETQSENMKKYKDSSHYPKKFGGIRKCKKNKSRKCKKNKSRKCKKNKSRKCKRSKKLLKRSKTGKKIKNSRKKIK